MNVPHTKPAINDDLKQDEAFHFQQNQTVENISTFQNNFLTDDHVEQEKKQHIKLDSQYAMHITTEFKLALAVICQHNCIYKT